MAMVITLAQQKGGTGKTTLAANIAAALAGVRRVALLDTDPQHSLSRWHQLRTERQAPATALAFSEVAGWRLGVELDRLRRGHDLILIDSPPQIDTDARLAIRAADLVLIPVQPSPPDLWAADGTMKLVAAERRTAAHRAESRARRLPLARNRQADIAARGLPMLRTVIGNRTGFALAFAAGLGVTEAAPRSVAAAELRALVAELEELP